MPLVVLSDEARRLLSAVLCAASVVVPKVEMLPVVLNDEARRLLSAVLCAASVVAMLQVELLEDQLPLKHYNLKLKKWEFHSLRLEGVNPDVR
jgi:hypothetical protein